MVTEVSGIDLRCSTQARCAGLDPTGTAVAMPAFLLVEASQPWPADLADHPGLAAAHEVAADLGARVQGLVPEPGHLGSGDRSVILYRHDDGPFRRYRRTSTVVTAEALDDGVRRVAAAAPDDDGATIDVLVCAHGSRDRCCGSLGTTLARAPHGGPDVALRRTSHLGGHRFAPTALVLPYGTAWAWLDDRLLDEVLGQTVEPAALAGHYRGSTVMPGPALQLMERAVFTTVGWSWLDEERSGHLEPVAPGRWETRIDSTVGSWEAVVERVGTAPQPPCGRGPEPGVDTKVDEHLRLVQLRQTR